MKRCLCVNDVFEIADVIPIIVSDNSTGEHHGTKLSSAHKVALDRHKELLSLVRSITESVEFSKRTNALDRRELGGPVSEETWSN